MKYQYLNIDPETGEYILSEHPNESPEKLKKVPNDTIVSFGKIENTVVSHDMPKEADTTAKIKKAFRDALKRGN